MSDTDTESRSTEQRLISIDAAHPTGPIGVETECEHHHDTITGTDPDGNRDFVMVVADVTDEQQQAIEARDEVRYTEYDVTRSVQGEPHPDADEPDDGGVAAAGNTQKPGYWITKDNARTLPAVGQDLHIAVIDSGCDSDHPDLEGRIGSGHAVVNTTIDGATHQWEDDHGHGTHCSGIIAANNNLQGMRGIAPSATVHPVKVLNQNGRGTGVQITKGFVHVANMSPRPLVASCSFGGSSTSRAERDAIAHCVTNGISVVCAAGNSSSDVIYPAALDDTIAVSATDQDDQFADFSCYGPEVDIATPGVGIRSTLPGGRYQAWDGTSMSTPQDSATIGLLRSPRDKGGKNMSHEEAKAQLERTADDIDLPKNKQGAGRTNAGNALVADGGTDKPPWKTGVDPDINALVVAGDSGTGYEIGVYGEPTKSSDLGSVQDSDTISKTTDGEDFDFYIRGNVGSGDDAYVGWHRVHHVHFEDPKGAALEVFAAGANDGAGKWFTDIDIKRYGTNPGWSPGDDADEPDLVAIVGQGDRVSYRLTAEQIGFSDAHGGTVQNNDHINDDHTEATGTVSTGTDTYSFRGDFGITVDMDSTGGVTVLQQHNSSGDWDNITTDAMPDTDPAPPENEYPNLPEGGYEFGEGTEVRDIPNSRNREQVATDTTHEIVLWVGPDGDDANAGSKSNPLASIDEAVRRLPVNWWHDIFVFIKPGEYHSPSGEGLTLDNIHQTFFDESRDGFSVRGVGDKRTDVEFIGYRQFNSQLNGIGSYDNVTFENITLNGTFTGYRGGYGILNCKINPTRGNKVAIAGYDTTIHAIGCEFGDDTEHAVKAKETSDHVLNKCTGTASTGVVTGGVGDVTLWWGNDIDAPDAYDVTGPTHARVWDKDATLLKPKR